MHLMGRKQWRGPLGARARDLHATATIRGLWVLSFSLLVGACALRGQAESPVIPPTPTEAPSPLPSMTPSPSVTPDPLALLPPSPIPGEPLGTPTPDPPRPQPTLRTSTEWHIVVYGDSVGVIAARYGIGAGQIVQANGLINANLLSIGQVLEIPPPIVDAPGPSHKILPDSALVYGPATIPFDLNQFTGNWMSYLNAYTEEVDGVNLSGPGIVLLVAQRYSVDPRLLLALVEAQSGWVRSGQVSAEAAKYPVGYRNPEQQGLFAQLSWAADQLNLGFYRWRAGWAGPFVFGDGRVAPAGTGINAGTAGVQHLFSQVMDVEAWRQAMAPGGFDSIYRDLFGDPFATAIEPVVPDQPGGQTLQLPFETGKTWSFTGGPHSAWGDGAAWAALDFAPPGYALGCVWSDEWVTAIGEGPILRAENGAVIQDLDGDGYEQSGWVVLYMHISEADRVAPGTRLRPGDRIGHPSCEGGISNGTHVHVARRYNGEWIPADGPLPFVLDGWVSAGLGGHYDGTMTRGEVVLEACGCRNEENQIAR